MDQIQALKMEILEHFALKPYDGNLISEEEFIYDGLNCKALYQVLNSSLRTFHSVEDSSDSSTEDEADEMNKEMI